MEAEFSISFNELEERTTIVVQGTVNINRTRELREAITTHGHLKPVVVLDFSNVGFIDSNGIAALIGIHRQIKAAGHRFFLLVTDERTRRLMTITQLDRLMTVCADAGTLEAKIAG